MALFCDRLPIKLIKFIERRRSGSDILDVTTVNVNKWIVINNNIFVSIRIVCLGFCCVSSYSSYWDYLSVPSDLVRVMTTGFELPRAPHSTLAKNRLTPKKLPSLTGRTGHFYPVTLFSSLRYAKKSAWPVGDDTDVPGRIDSSGYLFLFSARPDISVARFIRGTRSRHNLITHMLRPQ